MNTAIILINATAAYLNLKDFYFKEPNPAKMWNLWLGSINAGLVVIFVFRLY